MLWNINTDSPRQRIDLSLKSALSTYWIQGWLRLDSETLSEKKYLPQKLIYGSMKKRLYLMRKQGKVYLYIYEYICVCVCHCVCEYENVCVCVCMCECMKKWGKLWGNQTGLKMLEEKEANFISNCFLKIISLGVVSLLDKTIWMFVIC